MRGATLKHRRGKKEMKQDQKDHYAGMAKHEPSEGAKKVDAESSIQEAHGGRFSEEGWDRYERECDE